MDKIKVNSRYRSGSHTGGRLIPSISCDFHPRCSIMLTSSEVFFDSKHLYLMKPLSLQFDEVLIVGCYIEWAVPQLALWTSNVEKVSL